MNRAKTEVSPPGTAKEGKCVATKDADCERTFGCTNTGA